MQLRAGQEMRHTYPEGKEAALTCHLLTYNTNARSLRAIRSVAFDNASNITLY